MWYVRGRSIIRAIIIFIAQRRQVDLLKTIIDGKQDNVEERHYHIPETHAKQKFGPCLVIIQWNGERRVRRSAYSYCAIKQVVVGLLVA